MRDEQELEAATPLPTGPRGQSGVGALLLEALES